MRQPRKAHSQRSQKLFEVFFAFQVIWTTKFAICSVSIAMLLYQLNWEETVFTWEENKERKFCRILKRQSMFRKNSADVYQQSIVTNYEQSYPKKRTEAFNRFISVTKIGSAKRCNQTGKYGTCYQRELGDSKFANLEHQDSTLSPI